MAIRLEPIIQEFKVENKLALAGIGAVTAAIGAVAATAALAVKGTFDWAKELDSLQDVMGVTSNEAAALNFVLRKSGTDTDALTKGMVVLEKGLFKTDGTLDTVGEKMLEFGINALDVNGKVKDQGSLIEEISNKYNSFATQTERVNFLTELFGRSGAELIDVFDTLAKEGGLDKTEEKVKSLGLAIDPQKYEDFQRNLEEIKLSFLGVAITVVDNLMPAVEGFTKWWEKDGLAAFQGMVKFLSVNVPNAVQTSQKSWNTFTDFLKRETGPTFKEIGRLGDNINTILGYMDKGLNLTVLAWNALMTVITPYINEFYSLVAAVKAVGYALDLVNDILEAGISAWQRYKGISAGGITTPVVTSTPVSTGTTGGGTRSTSGNRGRATGGTVIGGQAYNINEKTSKTEVLIPNRVGTVANSIDVKVSFTENELDKLGRSIARYMKPAQQRLAW